MYYAFRGTRGRNFSKHPCPTFYAEYYTRFLFWVYNLFRNSQNLPTKNNTLMWNNLLLTILFINSTVVCGDTYQKSCQTNWSFLKYVFSKFCPKNCWGNKKILVSTSHFRYFVHVVLNSKSLQLRSLVQFLFKKKYLEAFTFSTL